MEITTIKLPADASTRLYTHRSKACELKSSVNYREADMTRYGDNAASVLVWIFFIFLQRSLMASILLL